MAQQADQDGLDLISLSDHPYLGERLDAYAAIALILGRTSRLSGFANVTNLPLRPAPMLARTVTTLSHCPAAAWCWVSAPAGGGTASPTWAYQGSLPGRPSRPSKRRSGWFGCCPAAARR
ncbi:hypothetical protein Ato02nite_016720 [Paractinoplanes toevensis]|uniref:Luciferase-like domain-containing protein n=1 Tax=Paractinoplanes toevensis TaxID=571911 RepID=A0A919T8Y0_9ACTN|nr:hypothetical protein Ato02nite_016720 [Actinoplanes toevensis]